MIVLRSMVLAFQTAFCSCVLQDCPGAGRTRQSLRSPGGTKDSDAAAAVVRVRNTSNREEVEHDFKPLAYFPSTHNKQLEEASPSPPGRSPGEIWGCTSSLANSSRRARAHAGQHGVSDVAAGRI